MSVSTDFTRPGTSHGLFEVVRKQYLLQLLVHKELRVRYRGSILGMLWSYAKPATQFLVFYLFAGVVAVNYFSEIFGNCTRSLVQNQDLVKKIYLPRQLFPVSSVWVAFVHFVPQVVILIIGSLIFGWRPGINNLLAVLLAFVVLTIFSLGLGLLGGAFNVLYRDAENFVDLILMVATWASPVLYKWSMVYHVLGDWQGGWLWYVYQLNPLTTVVELFHYGFWIPTAGVAESFPDNYSLMVVASALISILLLLIGDKVFRHYDGRFAQEL